MRKVQVPAQEAGEKTQDLVSLSINYVNRTAEIGYGFGEVVDGRFFPVQSTVQYEQIDFDELMAGAPEWSPNKPAGNFRSEDVFAVLDRKHEAAKARKSGGKKDNGSINGRGGISEEK